MQAHWAHEFHHRDNIARHSDSVVRKTAPTSDDSCSSVLGGEESRPSFVNWLLSNSHMTALTGLVNQSLTPCVELVNFKRLVDDFPCHRSGRTKVNAALRHPFGNSCHDPFLRHRVSIRFPPLSPSATRRCHMLIPSNPRRRSIPEAAGLVAGQEHRRPSMVSGRAPAARRRSAVRHLDQISTDPSPVWGSAVRCPKSIRWRPGRC